MKIPIVPKSNIKEKPDCALVLAWNFINEIKKKNSDLAHKFIFLDLITYLFLQILIGYHLVT